MHSAKSTIDLLQEQIKIKDMQIETKDKQVAAQLEQLTQLTATLEHTTTSLQATQALHAETMQQMLPGGDSDKETPEDVAEGLQGAYGGTQGDVSVVRDISRENKPSVIIQGSFMEGDIPYEVYKKE